MVLEQHGFQSFMTNKYETDLHKFKLLIFKLRTLSKVYTTDVRLKCLKQDDVAIHHDFTEALHMKHNEEIQSKHFGGGTTASIEGYTVQYPQFTMDGDDSFVFDFRSFLVTIRLRWPRLFTGTWIS